MDHGNQHWVPSSYLEAWCDPDLPPRYEPYVWRFPKDGGEGRRKAPANIFAEADFYTIHLADGGRDLSLEHGLGTLEQEFARIREKRIAKREPLNREEKGWFCAFVAAMHARTRGQRDALRQQWGHGLKIAEDLQAALVRMTPEQRRELRPHTMPHETSGPALSIDDVRKLADQPLPQMLPTIIAEDLPLLMRMNLSIFTTGDDVGFVTSDSPCRWFDPGTDRIPFMLRSPTIEVTMPVSPNSFAVISWEDLPHYRDASLSEVHAANRNQQIACDEYLIVRRNVLSPVWFS